jgi:hypothetical protein
MKKYILILTTGIVLITSCTNAQETSNVFNAESVIKLAQNDEDLEQWTLDTLYLRFEKKDGDIKSTKALLLAVFMRKDQPDSKKTIGFEFDQDKGTETLVFRGIKHTCSGVNCSNCDLVGVFDINCKCEKKAHPQSGASYCNHTVSSGGIYSGYRLNNDKEILRDANAAL